MGQKAQRFLQSARYTEAMLADVQHAIEALPRDEPLIFLADFDGTLAEFHPNPAAPMLTEIRREWLRDIAAQGLTFAGIVSGRRVADLRRRAPLPSTRYYAGLHGMEIETEHRRWQHPDLDTARAHVHELLPLLEVVLDRFPGALLEDKPVSVAVHVRAWLRLAGRGPGAGRWVRRALALPTDDSGDWRMLVVEYLPNTACHKGDAVEWIANDVAAKTGQQAVGGVPGRRRDR